MTSVGLGGLDGRAPDAAPRGRSGRAGASPIPPDASPIPLVVFGPDGGVVEQNAAAVSAPHVGAFLELLSAGSAFVDGEGRALVADDVAVAAARRRGAAVSNQLAGAQVADGSWRWWRLWAVPDGDAGSVVVALVDVSDDRSALAALRTAAREHDDLIEGLIEGVVAQGPDGSILTANRGAESALGLSREQMAGRESVDPRWRAIREDGTPWPGEVHPSMEALRTGEPQLMQIMGIHRPAGDLRWILINSRPSFTPEGRVGGVVSSFLDISDLRRAEQASAFARERLEVTLENLAEGVVFWDAEGRPVLRNAATERLRNAIAVRIDDAGHHSPPEVVSRDGRSLVEAEWPWVVARRSGRSVTGAVLGFRDPSGHVRWMEVSAAPIGSDTGPGPYEVTMSMFDVTERLAHEERLRAAETQLRTIIDRSPIGMGLSRPDGTIVRVNDAFATIVGRSSDELVGRARVALTHPDDRAAEGELLAEVLAGARDGYRVEKRYLRPSGSVVWVQADVTVLRDEDGAPALLVGHVQDIGDRRAREEELTRHADEDPLTGLANRRAFERALEGRIAHARRFHSGGAVLLIDLDRFKDVNDTLGHAAGDALLVEIATQLRGRMRATDVVARLGGDEFAVLTPDGGAAEAEGARVVVAGVLAGVRRANGAGPVSRVHASIGIALVQDGGDAAEVVRRADEAMYAAKAGRR